MKLQINKACDLASISALPPRPAAAFSQGGGCGGAAFSQGGGGGGAAFSQGAGGGGGASFSQGGGGGCSAFSQGGGGGGAPFSQGGGGGGAAFSQGAGGGGGAAFSQGAGGGGGAPFSQGGGGGGARDQRFALRHDSSKRKSSFPANSESSVHEESQMKLAKIPSNPIHLPDSRCQVNEEVGGKIQHVASSVHKMGMLLDSVQNDVMQLNRSMKEASLDSGSIQKKFVLVEDSLQQILKGQDDLNALLLGMINSNSDQLSALNSHTSKLDEISSTLSVLKQVPEDLNQLKGDISRIFTKEMEGVMGAIRSLNSRPDAIQTLADQSCHLMPTPSK